MNSVSIYKLGRLILTPMDGNEMTQILLNYRNSIAGKFIIKLFEIESIVKPNTIITSEILNKRIDILLSIINEYIPNINHKLPIDIQQSTVIHLRLGDVIAGITEYEYERRPIPANEIKLLLDNDKNNNKYIIGKPFFSKESSINYDECIDKSNIYVNEVVELLNAKHISMNNSADIDLCCGIQAKLFVKGRGYYSKLITIIRKRLNRPVIE
jgi:hypothetical protein